MATRGVIRITTSSRGETYTTVANTIKELLHKGFENFPGEPFVKVVMDKDGAVVNEDAVLQRLDECVMLLRKGEEWSPEALSVGALAKWLLEDNTNAAPASSDMKSMETIQLAASTMVAQQPTTPATRVASYHPHTTSYETHTPTIAVDQQLTTSFPGIGTPQLGASVMDTPEPLAANTVMGSWSLHTMSHQGHLHSTTMDQQLTYNCTSMGTPQLDANAMRIQQPLNANTIMPPCPSHTIMNQGHPSSTMQDQHFKTWNGVGSPQLRASATATTSNRGRMTIKEWLKKKLDSNAYARSRWRDRDQGIFCIPWMKQDNREFKAEDAKIFEDWSRESGCCKKSDTTATWKSRFRCAITKSRHIRKLNDEMVDEDHKRFPYKVYQFVDIGEHKSSADHNGWQPECPVARTENSSAAQISTTNSNITVGGQPEVMQDSCTMLLGMDEHGNATQTEVPQAAIPTMHSGSKRKSDTCHSIEAQHEANAKVGNDNFVDNVGQIDMISFEETLDSHRFESKLSFYNEIPTDPEYTRSNYKLLPRIDANRLKNVDRKGAKKAKKISDPKCLKEGFDLEYDNVNGDIYATRKCPAHIFYSNCFTPSKSTKLVRDERTKIFDGREFETRLVAHHKDGSTKMPSNEVYLGFGFYWHFSEPPNLPISAIVRSRRFQSHVDMYRCKLDEADLDSKMSDLQISVDQASSMKESSRDDYHMDAIPTFPPNPGYITEAAAPVGERNLWGDQK